MLGRNPATMGLVAHRPCVPRARARRRCCAKDWTAGAASSSRRVTGSGPRHVSRRCGTRGSPSSDFAPQVSPEHPAPAKAGTWVLGKRCEPAATGAFERRVEPGGWAFEYDNDLYPDVDDAAVLGLALRELGVGRAALDPTEPLAGRHAVS